LIEDALSSLKTLVEIAPDNQDFKNLYLEANRIYDENRRKEKSMFKKMLFQDK